MTHSVWVVTKEYTTDYGQTQTTVVAVFDSEEKAIAYHKAKRLSGYLWDWNEFEVE